MYLELKYNVSIQTICLVFFIKTNLLIMDNG